MNNFWGFADFVDIFWGSPQNWPIFRGHFSMHFRVFSLGQGTEWGIFLGVAKISNIFWGACNA